MATTSTTKDSKGQGTGPKHTIPAPLADVQKDGKTAVPDQNEHEGATEKQVGDRGGPGVGFDQEPEREKDEGGVS